MADHYVIYNGGAQSINTVPYANGRPVVVASATYAILDLRYTDEDDDQVVVASGTSATVDNYSDAITATAGVGSSDRSRLDVSDVTGLAVGDRLLLEGGGRQQLVEVRDLDVSSNYIYVTGEIDDQYASGATVKGIECAATFPSEEAADEDRFDQGGGPYAVDWKFDGVPGVFREMVYVRRHARRPSITVRDVEMLDPMAVRATGHRFPIDDVIHQAQRDFHVELMTMGIKPEHFDGGEIEQNCVAHRAAYLLRLHMGRDEDDAVLEAHKGRWLGLLNNLRVGVPGVDVVETDRNDSADDDQTNSRRGIFNLS